MTELALNQVGLNLSSQRLISFPSSTTLSVNRLLSYRDVIFSATQALFERNTAEKTLWQQTVTDQLLDLVALEEDWDTYGSLPPDANAVKRAGAVLKAFANSPFPFPIPRIQATSEGGITINWHEPTWEFGLEVDSTAEVVAFYRDRPSQEAWEMPMAVDDDRIHSAIHRLIARP